MSTPVIVATMALQGAAAGVSCELAVRCLFRKRDKNTNIRVAKFLLGVFMVVKSIAFLSFHSNQGHSCYATGRVADLFYQLAMTAGNHILLARVHSILPIHWRRRGFMFHTALSILRFIIGVVDVVLIKISIYEDGTCEYRDEEFWGPVYTLYDTIIDLYVTMMISGILISHIRALLHDRMKVNTVLYTSVIIHNVIRTVVLTIVNLISAIFIIVRTNAPVLMLLWPIINIFFVVLVGYDSDVTKAIRELRQKQWRTPSNVTSGVDLTRIQSISRPNIKSDNEDDDPEQHIETANEDDSSDDLGDIDLSRTSSETNA